MQGHGHATCERSSGPLGWASRGTLARRLLDRHLHRIRRLLRRHLQPLRLAPRARHHFRAPCCGLRSSHATAPASARPSPDRARPVPLILPIAASSSKAASWLHDERVLAARTHNSPASPRFAHDSRCQARVHAYPRPCATSDAAITPLRLGAPPLRRCVRLGAGSFATIAARALPRRLACAPRLIVSAQLRDHRQPTTNAVGACSWQVIVLSPHEALAV